METTEEYISLKEASKILGMNRTTLWRQCKDGKIPCKEIPDKRSPSGKTYEVAKSYVFKKGLDETTEEKKPEPTIETDIGKKIDALNLPPLEAERVKAILNGLSKAEAEKVLKTEQALSKTKDNVAMSGFYVEKEKVAQQIGQVFSTLSRSLKDLISVWQKRYNLDDDQHTCMMMDFEKAIKKSIEDMKKCQ